MTRKPTMAERGYGREHRRERAKWAREVERGGVHCVRCGGPILPGSRWHLDHTDDRTGYLGPAHPGCNVSAMNRRRARLARQALDGTAVDTPPSESPTIPDPTPENRAERWSRHWYGPANPRCPYCRELGGPCADATECRITPSRDW